jgi:hypothetical protein
MRVCPIVLAALIALNASSTAAQTLTTRERISINSTATAATWPLSPYESSTATDWRLRAQTKGRQSGRITLTASGQGLTDGVVEMTAADSGR